jgi:hypothetical protein
MTEASTIGRPDPISRVYLARRWVEFGGRTWQRVIVEEPGPRYSVYDVVVREHPRSPLLFSRRTVKLEAMRRHNEARTSRTSEI